MPRRRMPRPSLLPRRSDRSLAISRFSFAHALELGGAVEVLVLALASLGGPRRRGRRVLRLPHRDVAEHRVRELQRALDLGEALGRRAVLEQDVEAALLLPDRVREIAEAPLLHLAHGAALLLDERPDAGRELFRPGLALVGMDQDQCLIAAIRHALSPSG